jgi:L-aminopeptidase/D-esterase-like protein
MAGQRHLKPDTSIRGRRLEFDFPSLSIGVAEYPEGPTGTTVFRFATKAIGAVDVRGGAPGAYNVDWLRLGYSWPNLDAVVVSGGSWYGLGGAAGAAAALKEDGHRGGHWTNLANVAGAIVYDFGERRPNEHHPDERLGAAALRAARPGVFPQGAHGAGRMTMQASYFGLWLHSGQGGAFRQVGLTKVACFSVVNAVGAVVDRAGRLSFGNQAIPSGETHIGDLIAQVPDRIRTVKGSILGQRYAAPPNTNNTTISLVVTNQRLDFAQLQRLAVQVHTSMGRAIQPFATLNDGDVLFAASTCEVENASLHPTDLGTVASEVMWDAILNSVPDIPKDVAASCNLAQVADPRGVAGRYGADAGLQIEIAAEGEVLTVRNVGSGDVFGVAPGQSVAARPAGGQLFVTDNLILSAVGFKGAAMNRTLVLNPGPWQQVLDRQPQA